MRGPRKAPCGSNSPCPARGVICAANPVSRCSPSGLRPSPRISSTPASATSSKIRRHSTSLPRAGGFALSTRHIGIDFQNGLSLVQATDIFPDRLHVDPAQKTYSLVAHLDTTFSLVPSTHQAFAAARVYRDLAGFQPAGGVGNLLGRICLDQWGGDCHQAAQDIETAAHYGVTDAVFVKHVWQRWGYDYRLPDIYPPAGNNEDFLAMVKACKDNGILFLSSR